MKYNKTMNTLSIVTIILIEIQLCFFIDYSIYENIEFTMFARVTQTIYLLYIIHKQIYDLSLFA